MKADIYNQKGKIVGSVALSESLFSEKWNADLVHQVVVAMESNSRHGTASTKGRSEVRGGGRKPWRQKGTGRARHGSRRSPIWVGGGVTHGPTSEKNYKKKINKKMRAKALACVLTKKYNNKQILFLDEFTFKEPKTKKAKEVLGSLAKIDGFEKISTKKRNAVLISLDEGEKTNVKKSFGNFGNVKIKDVRNLNPVFVLNSTYLVIENPEKSLSVLENRLQ